MPSNRNRVDRSKRKGHNVKALTFIVLIIMVAAVVFVTFSMNLGQSLSILPAEEGLSMGVYGFQTDTYGTVYNYANQPPSPWAITNPDPHNYVITHTDTFPTSLISSATEPTILKIEFGQAYRSSNPFQSVSYVVKMPDGKYANVKGDIWVYSIDISLSVAPPTGGYVFRGTNLWMQFATTVWNKVISDPTTGQQGQVWGAPISCYVESYTDTWNGAVPASAYIHNSVDPSNVGRFVTLYSGAAAYGTIGDLGISGGSSANSTLFQGSSPYAPDSRMQTTGYFNFILNDFGVGKEWGFLRDMINRYFPAVNYKLKVYYLQVGSFVYTKDQAEYWGLLSGSTVHQPNPLIEAITGFVGSVLTIFGAVGGIIFFVIIAVVFILIFAIASSLRRGKVPMPSMPIGGG
jgi:hypothetical protein